VCVEHLSSSENILSASLHFVGGEYSASPAPMVSVTHSTIFLYTSKQGCSANQKGVGTHQKFSHFITVSNSLAKHEKGVGTPFPRIPDPLHL